MAQNGLARLRRWAYHGEREDGLKAVVPRRLGDVVLLAKSDDVSDSRDRVAVAIEAERIPREYMLRLLGEGCVLEMAWPPSGPWQMARVANADDLGP